jgi:hypothetical protein
MLGGSPDEAYLSKVLNGHKPLSEMMEKRILDALEKGGATLPYGEGERGQAFNMAPRISILKKNLRQIIDQNLRIMDRTGREGLMKKIENEIDRSLKGVS